MRKICRVFRCKRRQINLFKQSGDNKKFNNLFYRRHQFRLLTQLGDTTRLAGKDGLVHADDATPLAQLGLEVLRDAQRHASRRHERVCVAFRGAFHHLADEAESARARLMRRGDGYGTSPRHEVFERAVLADQGSDARPERRHDVPADTS